MLASRQSMQHGRRQIYDHSMPEPRLSVHCTKLDLSLVSSASQLGPISSTTPIALYCKHTRGTTATNTHQNHHHAATRQEYAGRRQGQHHFGVSERRCPPEGSRRARCHRKAVYGYTVFNSRDSRCCKLTDMQSKARWEAPRRPLAGRLTRRA